MQSTSEFRWSQPDRWPHDTDKLIFLARALNLVGADQVGDASELTEKQRFWKAADAMLRWLADGKVTGWLRPLHGGAARKVATSVWHSEKSDHWFEQCSMVAAMPYLRVPKPSVAYNRMGHQGEWLFLSRDELDRLLGRSAAPEAISIEASNAEPEPAQPTAQRAMPKELPQWLFEQLEAGRKAGRIPSLTELQNRGKVKWGDGMTGIIRRQWAKREPLHRANSGNRKKITPPAVHESDKPIHE